MAPREWCGPSARCRMAARTFARLATDTLHRLQRSIVLEGPEAVRQEATPLDDRGRHVGELELGELHRRDRLAKRAPFLAVGQRGLEAGARGTHRSPADPEARLVETGQWPAHAGHAGQYRAVRARGPDASDSSEVTDARSDSLLCTSDVVESNERRVRRGSRARPRRFSLRRPRCRRSTRW